MKILSFELKPSKRGLLATYFRQKLSVVDEVSSSCDLPEMLSTYGYDAVIVQIEEDSPSDLDAIGFIKSLNEVPVILVAKSLGNWSRLAALEAGADDLIVSPLSHEEVFLKVQNLVRRASGIVRHSVTVGSVVIDMNAKCIYANGSLLSLTRKEYMVVEALVIKGGFMSKEALLDHLYEEGENKAPKILDVFVCKIRRKMKAAGVNEFISTRWGYGFVIEGLTPHMPPVGSNNNKNRENQRAYA
jgi:two-component system cell cycle response regulator CtrA